MKRLLLIALSLLLLVGCGKTKSTESNRMWAAWTIAQQDVKNKLTSPSGADFGDQDPLSVVTYYPEIESYIVDGFVESENRLGVRIKAPFVSVIEKIDADHLQSKKLFLDLDYQQGKQYVSKLISRAKWKQDIAKQLAEEQLAENQSQQ